MGVSSASRMWVSSSLAHLFDSGSSIIYTIRKDDHNEADPLWPYAECMECHLYDKWTAMFSTRRCVHYENKLGDPEDRQTDRQTDRLKLQMRLWSSFSDTQLAFH